jgi:hypothetical protein
LTRTFGTVGFLFAGEHQNLAIAVDGERLHLQSPWAVITAVRDIDHSYLFKKQGDYAEIRLRRRAGDGTERASGTLSQGTAGCGI